MLEKVRTTKRLLKKKSLEILGGYKPFKYLRKLWLEIQDANWHSGKQSLTKHETEPCL